MSSRNFSFTSASDEVEKLKCSVCLDVFQTPKLLPCSHTYCLPCAQKLVSQHPDKTSFSCPECKSDITIPRNGAAGFPNNRYIMDDLEKLRALMEQVCGPCLEYSKNQIRATHSCQTCAFKFCKACSESHNFHFRDHLTVFINSNSSVLLPPSSLASSESDFVDTRHQQPDADAHSLPRCTKHAREDLRFFCEHCNLPICRDCRMTAHFGHEPVVDLADFSARALAHLRADRDKVADLVAIEQAKLTTLVDAKGKVEKSGQDVKMLVNARADTLIREVEACRKKVMIMLEGETHALNSQIDEELGATESKLRYWQETERNVSRIIENGSDLERIESEAVVRAVLNDETNSNGNEEFKYKKTVGLYLIKEDDFDIEALVNKFIGKVVQI